MPHYLISVLADTDTNRCFHKLHFHLIQFLQFCDFADFLYSGFRENCLHYSFYLVTGIQFVTNRETTAHFLCQPIVKMPDIDLVFQLFLLVAQCPDSLAPKFLIE